MRIVTSNNMLNLFLEVCDCRLRNHVGCANKNRSINVPQAKMVRNSFKPCINWPYLSGLSVN